MAVLDGICPTDVGDGGWRACPFWSNQMVDKPVNIELAHYRNIREWRPVVGDVIIKHGWIVRTKWFGIINFIHPTGEIDVIKDGMVRLLVTTSPSGIRAKTITMSPDDIRNVMQGTYAVMQQNVPTNTAVWYV